MALTVGSLFSGIGGLELGFERAGFEVRWQVEIDPWCRKVLTKHWPNVPKYEDVRDVGANELEWVDVIVGGFPCQDISNAGKRAGITGERSGLWSEYARIVRALRPRYVVVENVAALLHRGLDVVLGDLAQSGYDAEWQVLPAAAFGAPHRRDRLFLVAYTSGLRCDPRRSQQSLQGPGAPGPSWEQLAAPAGNGWGQGRAWRLAGKSANGQTEPPVGVAHADRFTGQCVFPTYNPTGHLGRIQGYGGNWDIEPPVGRVVDGVPYRLVQQPLKGYGNAVVPQVAQYVAECVKAHAEAS